MRRHLVLLPTTLIALLALHSVAIAGAPTPIGTTGAYEDRPSLAVAPNANRALVVYEVTRGKNTDVAGALLDAKTGAVLKRFAVAGGPLSQDQPAVAYNNGAFLVVYVDCKDTDCTQSNVVSRAVSTAGTRGKTVVIESSTDALSYPAVAANPTSKTYLVAWSHATADLETVEGAIHTAAGVVVARFSNRTGTEATTRQSQPVAAENTKNGGYMLAFVEDRDTAVNVATRTVTGKGVLGRIRSVGGGAETLIPAIEYQPFLNQFFVTFENEVIFPSGGAGIFARSFNGATGRPLGSVPRQISFVGEGETCSAVAFSPSENRYLVTYSGLRPIGEFDRNFELEGMRLDGAGSPVGTTEVAFGEGETGCSAIEWSEPAKAFLVAWDQTDANYRNSDVWARVCPAKLAC